MEQALTTSGETFWEKVATTRWGSYISDIETRMILQAHGMAGKPGRALEIGCEGGRWSKMLSDLGWQMVCVDVNPEVLAACRRKIPNAEFILSAAEDRAIPYKSSSMDLLLCIEVAPVIDSDWFLPEAARILRSGGILAAVVWNRASARAFIHARKNKSNGNDKFYHNTYSRWKTDLGKAGFYPVHEEGFCWGPFDRTSNSPLIPLATKFERLLGLHFMVTFSPWVAVIAKKN